MKNMTRKAVSTLLLAGAVTGAADAAWYDDVKFKGDLRYRFENEDNSKAGSETKNHRNRLRFRYGAYGKINESMDFGFRLATGDEGKATSTNQDLANNFAGKTINLDLAYATIKFNDMTKLTVGKMKNPFYAPQKSQRVWDGDVNPEGLAINVSAGHFFGTVAYLVPDSSTKDMYNGSDVKEIGALQLGFKTGGFKGAAAYYKASSEINNTAASLKGGAAGGAFINLGLEYNFKLGHAKAAVYGDYVQNQDESNSTTADDNVFEVGFNIKSGAWKAGLAYLDAGSEGATGFQDGDFLKGGSDSGAKGFKVGAGYSFAKNASVGLTYFTGDSETEVAGGDEDRKLLQADLKFKF